MSPCEDDVVDSVRRLTDSSAFAAWLESEPAKPGDLILINNSFVFRDVKTTKADAFLSFRVAEHGAPPELLVSRGVRFNVDFKRMAAGSQNLPPSQALSEALEVQVNELGHLAFLLIGDIEDTERIDTGIGHAAFAEVVWDPTATATCAVDGERIVVSRTDDEELLWAGVQRYYDATGEPPPDGLRQAFGVALDRLQDEAVARVRIPDGRCNSDAGITDRVLTVLREQRNEYASAIDEYEQAGDEASPRLNDILRIAYNFSSDATGFLRLIVSLCDLKPIVLWGTIAQHHALSEAFNALPWSRSKHKPSLSNYQRTIADARNSAFHNLFPFRKSLSVPLPEAALGTPELRIFSEHTRRSENQLTYRDKELVDVLLEFTRARERRVSLSFWKGNLAVMDAAIALFQRTNDFLKVLAALRRS
ncbi:MAG: hypothetical protein KJ066_22765 [Acidobacteria bacterium]|nr:hypothetical protein [Acidobacteriota bacterium]